MPRGRRAEAKKRGEKQYFTGTPCKRGHIAPRWTVNGQCETCRAEWVKRNPERRKAAVKKYRQANPDQSRIWKEQNKERVRQKMREWRAKNPHKVGAYQSVYRARKFNVIADNPEAITAYLKWARTAKGLRCEYCNDPVAPNERHIDHKVPLSKGGAHAVSNMCVACSGCNLRKHNKDVEEFAEYQRRLREAVIAGFTQKREAVA